KEWLTKNTIDGLLCLSCSHGEIGRHLLNNETELATEALLHWQNIFGKNNCFIELQKLGKPYEDKYIDKAIALAQKNNAFLVATGDIRFLNKQDFDAHEVRVAINSGYTLIDDKRPQPYTDEQYFCSDVVMQKRFSNLPQALENSVIIAKRCNVTLELNKICLPDFPTAKGTTMKDHLIQLSKIGLEDKFKNFTKETLEKLKDKYCKRLETELTVINNMGFAGYFLIVADFIRWSKAEGIPVGPGRGSGAGSLVAYVLGITDIDPIPYDLLFERFLNPERVSMPDFDIDFCIEGRDKVIAYVADKYGRDSVSQIITFGSMAAKAVIRDVGRVMSYPYGLVDSIAKLIPFEIGMTLEKAMDCEAELKKRYEEDDEIKELINMSLRLEGTVRNVGKHAGGIVIAPTKLTEFMPIYCEANTTQIVSQFDKDDVEAIGLVKFDFLGLRNLTIIDNTINSVNALRKKNNQQEITIEQIPLDDTKTFSLMCHSKNAAVFQLESRGMNDLITRLRPNKFDDVVALVALYRPGPLQSGMVDDFVKRRHGTEPITYPHPSLEKVLDTTYGVILYQEQVMEIARRLANYTLGEADLLRRAMGKKKFEEMAKQRDLFLAGAQKNNIEAKTAERIFDLMEKFAGYGFNKSHSVAYAMISYQTAWLRANYPSAFMAAVLSSDMDNTEKVAFFVRACTELKLTVLAPDINQGNYKFIAKSNTEIVYGLGAIKGVGQAVIETIVQERQRVGRFPDIFAMCKRVNVKTFNKRGMEALIKSGAMDTFGPRTQLLENINIFLKYAQQHHNNLGSGQEDLFANIESASLPKLQPAKNADDLLQKLLNEKEVLGIFLSGHPVDLYQNDIRHMRINKLNALPQATRKTAVNIVGLVQSLRKKRTKAGNVMQIVTLDDGTCQKEIIVFSDVLARHQDTLKEDNILYIKAEVSPDRFSGGERVVVQDIMTIEQASMSLAKGIRLHMDQTNVSDDFLKQIKATLQQYQGSSNVTINYKNNTGSLTIKLPTNWSACISTDSIKALQEIVSKKNLSLLY
ncbi:MAG: DNA polymerase III subunit alpha, partial [Thiotrichales bacterium]